MIFTMFFLINQASYLIVEVGELIMRTLVKYSALILLALLAALLAAQSSEAGEWHLLRLDELSVDYKNYALVNDKARNLLIYPEHPKEGINVNLNTSLLNVVYWNSTIESLTTGAQYKSIGLQMGLGVRITPALEVGYWHHSQHVLDGKHPYMKFPSEDALTVKIYMYRVDKPQNTLIR